MLAQIFPLARGNHLKRRSFPLAAPSPWLRQVSFARGLRPLATPLETAPYAPQMQNMNSTRKSYRTTIFLWVSGRFWGSRATKEPWGRVVMNDPTAVYWVLASKKRIYDTRAHGRGCRGEHKRGIPKGEILGRLSGSTRCSC